MTSTTATEAPSIPHRPGRLPIVGDLFAADMTTPCQALAPTMAADGGIIEQRIFNFSAVIVSRTDLVNEVNNEENWEKHVGPALWKMRPLAHDGLFTARSDEPNWSKAHNVLMPAFTKTAMASYHPTMLSTVNELITAWEGSIDNWIDVQPDANRLATEVVSRVGIGHSFNHLSDTSPDPFVTTFLRELTYANRRTDAIPFYDRTIGAARRRQHKRDKTWLRQEAMNLIEQSRARDIDPARPNMLDTMLHSIDPNTGQKLDDDNIINQVLTLLIAGSETSANTMSFALHQLATAPELAAAARAEIDERLNGRPFSEITFDDIAPLRLLRRIVDETLRLWPTAPGYFRKARRDTTLGGQYPFARGQWVFVLTLASHRDPTAWGPDALEFNPDRFLAENLRKLGPYIYKPWGTGPRSCIGRQFALHETMLFLAAVLHRFDVEPDPEYQLTVRESITLKPQGLRLRLRDRRA